MKFNHNILAFIAPIVVAFSLAILVHFVPEIGIAPQETTGKVLLRVAIFFMAWPIALRFLGGWDYSVTKDAKSIPYGMTIIGAAIIIATAMVISK